jgi:hypothetical protein
MTNTIIDQEPQTFEHPPELANGIATFVTTIIAGILMALSFVTMILDMLSWWFVIPAALLKLCGVVHIDWVWVCSPILLSWALHLMSMVCSIAMAGAVGIGAAFSTGPALRWYEATWAYAPALFILCGGWLSPIVAVIAAYINHRLFQTKMRAPLKFISTASVTGGVYLCLLVSSLVAYHNGFLMSLYNMYTGQYQKAVSSFSVAISQETQPRKLAQCYACRGMMKENIGDNAGTVADISKAEQIDSTALGPNVFVARAFARKSIGDYKGALDDCEHAIRLNSHTRAIYKCRNELLKLQAQDAAIGK